MFFQNSKSNLCVHFTALIFAMCFGIIKIRWKLDLRCPYDYVKETRVKTR